MRKLMIAITVFGSLFTIVEAAAQQNHRRDHRAYRPHVANRYVAPPVRHYNNNHHRRASRNWMPYAVGGLALGALGGYYYNNQQQIRCWIEAQDMFNSRGRYLGTQEVKVCN